MESETVATVATVTEGNPARTPGITSGPPALMFIGYGVAMIAAGQWMLEEGIRRSGGLRGIRKLLNGAEQAVTVLEGTENDNDDRTLER